MPTMQEDANEIGRKMRALHARVDKLGHPNVSAMVQDLHDTLAQAFVTHLEPLGLDWNQVAGIPDNAPAGGMQTNAGVKTKPEASRDPA